jgi:hypothetical protein
MEIDLRHGNFGSKFSFSASIATISMDVDTAGKQAAAYLTDVAKKRVVVRSK